MNKDLPIEVIDLAQNDAFIRWVKAGCGKDQHHWYTAKSSADSTVADAILLVHASLGKETSYSEDRIDALFDRIESSIDTREIHSGRAKTRYLYWLSGVAAACMIAFFIFRSPELVLVETSMAEQSSYTLPEGSQVNLNADSHIRYKEKTFAQSRKMKLDGEAFFEVKKGDHFIVETAFGNVEVLGTSFNVYAREDRFEVQCVTGKVRVSSKNKKSFVILTPGQECMLDNGVIRKIEKAETPEDWRSGVFHFDNVNLESVIKELERQFDVRLKAAPHIRNIEYTGYFENKNFESAIQSVLWPLRLRLVQDEKSVYHIVSGDE